MMIIKIMMIMMMKPHIELTSGLRTKKIKKREIKKEKKKILSK